MSSKARNIMIKGAVVVGLAATCGISTVRGTIGMERSISTYRSMASQIGSASLPPECIMSESRIAKALEPILGSAGSQRVAKNLVPHVDDYRKRLNKAGSESERRKAATILAACIYSTIESEAIKQETTSQKLNWGWTFATMVALGEASQSGADGAVYGPTVKRCVDAITEICSS